MLSSLENTPPNEKDNPNQRHAKRQQEKAPIDEPGSKKAAVLVPGWKDAESESEFEGQLTAEQIQYLKTNLPKVDPEKLSTVAEAFPELLDPKIPDHLKADPNVVSRFFGTHENEDEKAKVYTLKCYYGDPDWKMPWELKADKKATIQRILQERGLPTDGTKKVLLERLASNRPYVKIDMDGRECLQLLVNTFLHFFEWDNDHLWEIQMPRRGTVLTGGVKLYKTLNVNPWRLKRDVEEYGPVLSQWHPVAVDCLSKDLAEVNRTLQDSMHDLNRILADNDTIGPERKLCGSCFDAFPQYHVPMDYINDTAYGGYLSLNDLALQPGDKLKVRYDFGDEETFTLFVERVVETETVLPRIKVQNDHFLRVRACLVERGPCKMLPQYGGLY